MNLAQRIFAALVVALIGAIMIAVEHGPSWAVGMTFWLSYVVILRR